MLHGLSGRKKACGNRSTRLFLVIGSLNEKGQLRVILLINCSLKVRLFKERYGFFV